MVVLSPHECLIRRFLFNNINKPLYSYCITSMSLELAISRISYCFSIAIFRQNPVFMFGIPTVTSFISQIRITHPEFQHSAIGFDFLLSAFSSLIAISLDINDFSHQSGHGFLFPRA